MGYMIEKILLSHLETIKTKIPLSSFEYAC
jgi:hypothetical protein